MKENYYIVLTFLSCYRYMYSCINNYIHKENKIPAQRDSKESEYTNC